MKRFHVGDKAVHSLVALLHVGHDNRRLSAFNRGITHLHHHALVTAVLIRFGFVGIDVAGLDQAARLAQLFERQAVCQRLDSTVDHLAARVIGDAGASSGAVEASSDDRVDMVGCTKEGGCIREDSAD